MNDYQSPLRPHPAMCLSPRFAAAEIRGPRFADVLHEMDARARSGRAGMLLRYHSTSAIRLKLCVRWKKRDDARRDHFVSVTPAQCARGRRAGRPARGRGSDRGAHRAPAGGGQPRRVASDIGPRSCRSFAACPAARRSLRRRSLVQAVLALVVAFGLSLAPDQIGAILAVTAVILGLITRSRVSPVSAIRNERRLRAWLAAADADRPPGGRPRGVRHHRRVRPPGGSSRRRPAEHSEAAL